MSNIYKPASLIPAWLDHTEVDDSLIADVFGTIATFIAAVVNAFTGSGDGNRNASHSRFDWERTTIAPPNAVQQPQHRMRAYGDQYQLITHLRSEISRLKIQLEREQCEKRDIDYDFKKQKIQLQEQYQMDLRASEKRWLSKIAELKSDLSCARNETEKERYESGVRWRQRKQELESSLKQESLERLRAYTHRGFWHLFDRDVQESKRHVLIVSPFVSNERVDRLDGIFREALERGVRIIVLARLPKDDEETAAHQALQAIGVVIHYRERFHQKLVIVDDILWEGSMNALSHHWNQQEHMRRIDHPELLMRALRLHKLTALLAPDSETQTDRT